MSKLDDYLNQITHVYTALSRKVIADLQEQLADAEPADVADIVRTIWDKWDVPGEYRDMLLDGAVKATEISVAVEAPIVLKSFYAQSVSLDGVKLSAKINDVMRTNETEALIRDAMQNQITIKNLAVKLVDEDLSSAKLPKYMEDLLTKARQAADLTGDTEAYAKYRRALSRATRQIDTLKDADDTSKLARAYRDVAELSTDASEKTVEKTIERAIMQKARANALRLAHTETARAYGNGAVYSAMQDKDAIGIRIELSGDHEGYCICDYFAESDMYGLGEGVYPVDELPEYPFHPYCQCSLSSVYKGDPDAEYDDNAAEAAFDDLDPEERQALVTKSGTWDDLDWKDHKLPKGYDEQIG